MSGLSLLSAFNRLSIVSQIPRNVRTITSYNPLLFRFTPCLCAEPLKKKKRLDPGLARMRDERKKRKIEKQIRKLEKHAKQLKPLDELEIPLVYLENKKARIRPAIAQSPEDIENSVMLRNDWSSYRLKNCMSMVKMIDRINSSQAKALAALKEVSEELYEAAITIDPDLVPYEGKGTVATPPIKNYDSPDGEYIDISKKWIN